MSKLIRKETLIVVIFIFVILLPVFDMVFKLDNLKPLNENRELAKAPRFSLTISAIDKFPAAYTKYFNDHFGLRKFLLYTNFIFKHKLLGVSPSAEVIIGKNGWLFYSSELSNDDFRGIRKYDAKTLKKWAESLEIKRVWLEKQGIRYLFVIAPSKSSIYEEFLPTACHPEIARTALAGFVDYLKKQTNVEVVDIRQALLEEKPKEKVYHKTDTHWNNYGAFLVYRQIMKPVVEWFPRVRIHTFDDYQIDKKTGIAGDLAGLMGLKEFFTEEHINLKPLGNYSAGIESINDAAKSPVTVEHNDNSLPRAVVFRDSFFSAVAPYLADHFRFSQYYWQYWNTWTPIEEILRAAKPDIVIEEIAERKITAGMADFIESPPEFNESALK